MFAQESKFSSLALGDGGIVALIGGGGKTSLLYALGKALSASGRAVLLTTTTQIYPPTLAQLPLYLIDPLPAQLQAAFEQTALLLAAGKGKKAKLCAPGHDFFSWCKESADFILVEADGAKHLPLKAPAEHEPALPLGTDFVIGVAGVDALQRPIAESCHRPELVAAVLGKSKQHILTATDMAKIILSPAAYQKNLPPQAKFRLVLNKCDTAKQLHLGEEVRLALRKQGATFPILLTSLSPPSSDSLEKKL